MQARTDASGVTHATLKSRIDSEVTDLKSDLKRIKSDTDNKFVFKGGTYNGVNVEVLADGGMKITGTCTNSINCKQIIESFYGNYSLVCESTSAIEKGSLMVVLRKEDGSQIVSINMDGTRGEFNSTAAESNKISMIDLTFIKDITYNTVIYVQLLNTLRYLPFVSPYSAIDRVARNKVNNSIQFVTPQMFGAKGDGVTNDYNAIQDALNSGCDVYFPEGTYLINNTLVVPASFAGHRMFANSEIARHKAVIKTTKLPALTNLGHNFEIDGLKFTQDNYPDITSGYELKSYLTLYGHDDLDIFIKNCMFEKTIA